MFTSHMSVRSLVNTVLLIVLSTLITGCQYTIQPVTNEQILVGVWDMQQFDWFIEFKPDGTYISGPDLKLTQTNAAQWGTYWQEDTVLFLQSGDDNPQCPGAVGSYETAIGAHHFSAKAIEETCTDYRFVLEHAWDRVPKLTGDGAVVYRFFDEVINGRNIDVINEIFAPNYLEYDRGEVMDFEERKKDIATLLETFPDMHVNIHDIVANGDRVTSRWTFMPTDGVAVSGVFIHRLENNMIVEGWEQFDNLGFQEQMTALQEGQEGAATAEEEMFVRIVTYHARPDSIDVAHAWLAENIPNLRQEPGIVRVDIFQSPDDDTQFGGALYFESQDAMATYVTSDYFNDSVKDMLETWVDDNKPVNSTQMIVLKH